MNELTHDEIILAGLGEINGRGRNRSLRQAVKGEMGASLYRRQFLERIHLLPKDIQKALMEGKAQISDAPYYSTAAITGSRTELLKLSTPEQLGVTNIDNGKLGKDNHLTLSGIRLLYDAAAINGKYVDAFPAELLNGEWELELNGKKVFTKQPIRNFFDGFYGYNVNKPFGLNILNSTKSISPQTPVEFNVNITGDLPGFLKVFLEGITVYGY